MEFALMEGAAAGAHLSRLKSSEIAAASEGDGASASRGWKNELIDRTPLSAATLSRE
jgi:hypothetical protein